MENPQAPETSQTVKAPRTPSLPQGLKISRLLQATSVALALVLGAGCSKNQCENIPNGETRPLPRASDNEPACFLTGDLYDQERARAFRQACLSQGRVARRWFVKYIGREAQNAHVCLATDTKVAWIPEADENFQYDGRALNE